MDNDKNSNVFRSVQIDDLKKSGGKQMPMPKVVDYEKLGHMRKQSNQVQQLTNEYQQQVATITEVTAEDKSATEEMSLIISEF